MTDVRMCGFERRTSVGDALERLLSRLRALPSERVRLADAHDRVAAACIRAEVAVPSFRRAMMDGYAVRADDTVGATALAPRRLAVVGDLRAGRGMPDRALAAGEAMRITTGAPVPSGADAVVMAELTEPDGDSGVRVVEAVSPAKHVAPVGEDVAIGDEVVVAGRRLRPQDVGLLASVGIGALDAVRRPTVTLLSTGDELLEPGDKPEPGRIVDSNSIMLVALCERDGAQVRATARVADDPAALRAAIERMNTDVLLLSGGSSVGPEDHVPQVVRELGELTVHGVAMRPSSPAGFGFIGDTAVFLLPGNPVSCLCAYEFFAGPAIRVLGGRSSAWPHRRHTAIVADKLVSVLGRTDYMRVRVDDQGVHPIMTSGASILSSTTVADGVVIIDDEREGFGTGDEVTVLLYDT